MKLKSSIYVWLYRFWKGTSLRVKRGNLSYIAHKNRSLRHFISREDVYRSLVLRNPIIVFLALIMCSGSQAQELAGNAGAFVDIGLGLRPLGMAGAYSAIADDENAARWNPAALSVITDPSSGFTWTNQFVQDIHNYISLSYPQIMGMGVGVYGISSGDDVYSEVTIGIGVGVSADKVKIPIENLHLGISFKYFSTSFGNDEEGGDERITGSSAGYGIDIGMLYRHSKVLSLALVLRDGLNDINWDSSSPAGKYSEGLPRRLVFAIGWEREKSTIALEYHPGLYSDVKDRAVFGAEVIILQVFRPRFGFAQNFTSGYTNKWITFGLGIELASERLGPIRNVSFGYTHMLHEIESTPRVGLSIGW